MSKRQGVKVRRVRPLAPAAAIAATAVGVFAFTGVSGADVSAVSGSAYGGSVDLLIDASPPNPPFPIVAPPTPSVTLPASGGNVSDSVPSMNIGPGGIFLLTGPANVSSSGVTGAGGGSTSASSVDNVNVLGGTLTATNVSSTCTASEAGLSGSTTMTNGLLLLSGDVPTAVDASPAPNTTFNGVNADTGDTFTVIFNEQVVTADAITVNAVHFILGGPLATGDIIVGQSHCDISVAGAGPATRDQCKNGGWATFPQFKNQGACVSFVEANAHANK